MWAVKLLLLITATEELPNAFRANAFVSIFLPEKFSQSADFLVVVEY